MSGPTMKHEGHRRHSNDRRRELLCLVGVLMAILFCLSCFAVINGDIEIPLLGITNSRKRNSRTIDERIGDFSAVQEAKLILLWTAWYKDPEWAKMYAKNGGPWVSYTSRNENGSVQRHYCYLTTNRSMTAESDALVFHSTDFYRSYSAEHLPQVSRRPEVPYIFFTLEPPQLNRLSQKSYRDAVNAMQFNYTMSYSRYSDIVFPFGRALEFGNRTRSSLSFKENVRYRINDYVQKFSDRPKDAVWIVSDCATMGRREYIVKSLKSHGIKVDTWGKCFGARQPDRLWRKFGIRDFFKQYRFYLAFENALCEEYITEKAFLGLAASANFGVIPIVYGYANYSQFLPEGSYIDATNMDSGKQLANIIKEMSAPSYGWKRLESYYQWQYQYYIPSDPNWRVLNGWRNLCRHLHSNNPPQPEMAPSLETSTDDEARLIDDESFIPGGSGSGVDLNAYNSSSFNAFRIKDIRTKIGRCIWTDEFDPENRQHMGLQF